MASSAAIEKAKNYITSNPFELSSLESADGLPLVTFDDEAMAQAAILLACKYGVGPDDWASRVLDLADQTDRQALTGGAWKANWSGRWVHVADGSPGEIVVGELIPAAEFFNTFARDIFAEPGFEVCLLTASNAAARACDDGVTVTPSVIEQLAYLAQKELNKGIRIFGARGDAWVPDTGLCAGWPAIGLRTLYNFRAAEPGVTTPMKDCLEFFFSNGLAVAKDFDKLVMKGREDGLPALAAQLTEAYGKTAILNEGKAKALPQFFKDEADVAVSHKEDIKWYVVDLA